ncbi:MAG: hypothetical protein LBS75_02935 [Synergistaceae bacterium]|nr:hypothetical protein [Synergistaceae bacterium]
MKRIFTAMALAILMVAATFGAAFAAAGDVVGLADFWTSGTARPNTYTADLGVSEDFPLEIVQVVEDASGDFVLEGFPTAQEALSLQWAQSTPGMQNGEILTATYSADISPTGSGFALYVLARNNANSVGPDSWMAGDPTSGANGSFSFVGTDYAHPDSGTVNGIRIEFYDADPTTTSYFAAGAFEVVNGNDDYDTVPGDYGRSYPTPLDAVAHGTLSAPYVISTYHKFSQTQTINDIVDMNGVTHVPGSGEGWLYAVYYPSGSGTFTRDNVSEYVGYDDYRLGEDALAIFAIGDYDDFKMYHSYFPDIIYR